MEDRARKAGITNKGDKQEKRREGKMIKKSTEREGKEKETGQQEEKRDSE